MEIDIRTLAIVLVIIDILQAIAFFFQYRINKTYRGIGWWVLGSSLAATGYFLLLLRDGIPNAFITIILANTLLIAGLFFMYIGIVRFLDQRENRWIIGLVFAIFLIAFSYFTYGKTSPYGRRSSRLPLQSSPF